MWPEAGATIKVAPAVCARPVVPSQQEHEGSPASDGNGTAPYALTGWG